MVCYPSKLKLFGLVCLGLVMVAASVFCATRPALTAQLAGWVGMIFFGACEVAIVKAFFAKGPQVVIDESGIEDRRQPFGRIPWADIRHVYFDRIQRQEFLCIDVYDPEIYLARCSPLCRRLARANMALGFPPITLSLTGLSPGVREVKAFLEDGTLPEIAERFPPAASFDE